MRLSVRLFAAFRERAGAPSVDIEVPTGATVAQVVEAVVAAAPGLRAMAGAARPVVNQEFVAAETVVAAGDEVALLPPVSGG